MARSLKSLMSGIPAHAGYDVVRKFRRKEASLLKKIREREFCNALLLLWLKCQLRGIEDGAEIADQLFAEWIGLCD
jgi:hypothetical protein